MRRLTILEYVPLLLMAICVPLALSLVEPNGFYGVRTAATAASEEAWYRINSISGSCGGIASLVGFAYNWRNRRKSMSEAQRARSGTIVVIAIAAVIAVSGLLAS